MCQSMPYLSLVGIQKWELINVSQKKKSRYKSRKRCEFLLSFFKDIFLRKIRLNLLFNFMNCVHLKQFVITRTFISNFKVIFLYWCFGQNIRSNEKWSWCLLYEATWFVRTDIFIIPHDMFWELFPPLLQLNQ